MISCPKTCILLCKFHSLHCTQCRSVGSRAKMHCFPRRRAASGQTGMRIVYLNWDAFSAIHFNSRYQTTFETVQRHCRNRFFTILAVAHILRLFSHFAFDHFAVLARLSHHASELFSKCHSRVACNYWKISREKYKRRHGENRNAARCSLLIMINLLSICSPGQCACKRNNNNMIWFKAALCANRDSCFTFWRCVLMWAVYCWLNVYKLFGRCWQLIPQ